MRLLSPEEFKSLVEAGHETRNLEFKPAFLWNDPAALWMHDKIIQTILGMTNTRDGGTIVLGVNESNRVLTFSGVPMSEFASLDRFDDIKGEVDAYSTGVTFELARAEHDGHIFVVINVREFDLIPAICRNDGRHADTAGKRLLNRGDIYTRAINGQPATMRVTESEMREILERAIDKGQRNLTGRGWRFAADTSARFEEQRGDF